MRFLARDPYHALVPVFPGVFPRSEGKRRCAPAVIRTRDLRIRNPLLYPAELRAQTGAIFGRVSYKIQ